MKHLILFFFICICPFAQSLWPFSSSSTNNPSHDTSKKQLSAYPAEFSISNLDDPKALELIEEARKKIAGPNSCSQNAYRSLFSSCAEIMSDNETQSRLAWHLSNCFETDTGRPALPSCSSKVKMISCLSKLDELQRQTYRDFLLQTSSICHHLQAAAFKLDTERLVNDLYQSARNAEEKLDNIEEKSEKLLQDSDKAQDSLSLLDLQAQQLAQLSKNADDRIKDVLLHSTEISEQSKGIAFAQLELQKGQLDMKEKLEFGMASLQEFYQSLDYGIMQIKEESIEIERGIQEVGQSMNAKMDDIQNKASDIEKVAETSLENQMKLLDVQAMAIKGLDSLTKSQSEALDESRDTLQRLAQLAQTQQQELLSRQEQIQQAHDRLIENSQSILSAQEKFEAKQANIFAALDKLFALHNAILVESRLIKAFFFYSCIIFLLYMLTSSKQTFPIRARLYLGLCITFALELLIIKFGDSYLTEQNQIMSRVFFVRSLFLVLAVIQILHSVVTYRDYEKLNHQLLLTLVNKVGIIEENAGVICMSDDDEDCISKYSWVTEELLEDVDSALDPDYSLPEEVGDNSVVTKVFRHRYNLRPQKQTSFCT